ncbi:MAG: ferredoxin [Propionibacteriaceae bacterium]|nr:ferredoxin [Micropruina sp.]HBX82608.1 ferredoxin [Propionibacteriaceae bacterium]HBY22938.1 ferredoxin [Propionibacteriaceae bacterium]
MNSTRRLRVDWPNCEARGLCFELLPERIKLDEWGYPIITGDIPKELLADAQEAVRACPKLAIRLVKAPKAS